MNYLILKNTLNYQNYIMYIHKYAFKSVKYSWKAFPQLRTLPSNVLDCEIPGSRDIPI